MRPVLLALALSVALPGCAAAACPAAPEVPSVPTIEERLSELRPWPRYGGLMVGEVFTSVAREFGLEPAFESEELRWSCFTREFPSREREEVRHWTLDSSRTPAAQAIRISETVPLYTVLHMAASCVECPVEGKDVGWQVRGNRLLVLVVDPPPLWDPSALDTEEKAKNWARAAEDLRARLKSEVTSFRMEGNTLDEALDYMSARHGFVFLMDGRTRKAAGKLELNIQVTAVPLVAAIEGLFAFAPALEWKVEGYWVTVRRK